MKGGGVLNYLNRIKKVGLTQRYVARKIGCSASSLNHFLHDRQGLGEICLAKLETLLQKYELRDSDKQLI